MEMTRMASCGPSSSVWPAREVVGGSASGWIGGQGSRGPGPGPGAVAERHYPCLYCHYSSRSRVDLDKHIRIHTGEKPFKCPFCVYMSGDKSNFRRHIQGVHKIKYTDLQLSQLPSLSSQLSQPSQSPQPSQSQPSPSAAQLHKPSSLPSLVQSPKALTPVLHLQSRLSPPSPEPSPVIHLPHNLTTPRSFPHSASPPPPE